VKRRAARLLGWGTCALTLILGACVVFLTVLNGGDFYDANFVIVGVASAVVGGVVASRRPANLVGWLFLAGALVSAIRVLAGEYAVYGIVTDPGALPLPYALAWLSNAMVLVGPTISFILIPLYFPDGRPVSRRWGFVGWVSVVGLLLFTVVYAFAPGEAVGGSGIQNPLGVEALRSLKEAYNTVVLAVFIGLILAAAGSLLVRFLRSVGEERQQLKWS
jgi:two-component system NarL family sensor kinase